MKHLQHLIRPDLQQFSPYSSARDEAKSGQIWLNANESPWTHEQYSEWNINRYPEKQPAKLIATLATLYRVEPDQLAIMRGSDEAIDLLMRLFCEAGKDSIVTCPPTFGMYAVYARLQGAHIKEIPLLPKAGFQLDMPQLLNILQPIPKLIFLCSPNNPTGNLLNEADMLQLCQHFMGKSIIVVDEAYIEFAAAESLSRKIDQYENLVILRTLSKAYGLAGARCGLLLANKYIVNWIKAIIAPYPLPAFTVHAVTHTFDKLDLIQQQITYIKHEREKLAKALESLPFIKKVWPSEANFLLLETNDAQKIMDACMSSGIVLRNMHDKLFLQNCIRITIGTPEENLKLIDFLRQCKE